MKELKKWRPKFNVGDKVKSIWNDTVCTVTSIVGNGYYIEDKIGNKFITFDQEMVWELAEETKPDPHTFGVTESDVSDIINKAVWSAVDEINKRNVDAFVGLIDETLRFMDCDAYVDDARGGMRQYVNELKKRLK